MVRATIDLPSEQMAALEARAVREARPPDDIVRDAVDRYLADPGTLPVGITDGGDDRTLIESTGRLPDWIGSVEDDDGALTSSNVDEWLETHWRPG